MLEQVEIAVVCPKCNKVFKGQVEKLFLMYGSPFTFILKCPHCGTEMEAVVSAPENRSCGTRGSFG